MLRPPLALTSLVDSPFNSGDELERVIASFAQVAI